MPAPRPDAPTQMAVDTRSVTPRDQAGGPLPAVAALGLRGGKDGAAQEAPVRPLRPGGRLSLTPELDGADNREVSASTSPVAPVPKLFPIFRPKSQWKVRAVGSGTYLGLSGDCACGWVSGVYCWGQRVLHVVLSEKSRCRVGRRTQTHARVMDKQKESRDAGA
jgi:hypothetical protein